MRCFTVTEAHVQEGLPFVAEPYPHVPVGEEGRGRQLTRFPVGRRFAEAFLMARAFGERAPRIDRASVIRTKEKGTLLLVEERDPGDPRALVLVRISAGYRGSTTWTGPAYEDANIHPDVGVVREYEPFPPKGITVLAEGWCAQGAAGRMGGHAERLLIMEPGAAIRVVRHGRLYGAPAVRYVLWTGQELKLGTRDEIWPPVNEEDGELI